MALGREDLSLARLAEAHFDAVAILAEAGKKAVPGALYGVWAAERPGREVLLESGEIRGEKMFLSGAGIVDRALVTVRGTVAGSVLVEVDLKAELARVSFDGGSWKSRAFAETGTASGRFDRVPIAGVVGEVGWYVGRPGFWHGACGPAACWAGGAAGLLDVAIEQSRDDPHTLAHLGAMRADVWELGAVLDAAGREIDAGGDDGMARALTVRHLVEQACTDVLRRFTRAYGPHLLAMDEDFIRRYGELDLYVRQSHAERDLEALGRAVKDSSRHNGRDRKV